jgi:hypothetical protein
VDPLRRDDIERARRASPEERAKWTLDLIEAGIRTKRAALKARYPDASDERLEALLLAWIRRDDDA